MNNTEVAEMYIELETELLGGEIIVKILDSRIKSDGKGLLAIAHEFVDMYIEVSGEIGYTKEQSIENLQTVLDSKKGDYIMNNFTGIGRLTRDPEMRYIAGSGTAVTNFTIAIDKGLSKDKVAEFEAQGKPTADFINVVAWAGTAEFAANYLAKGLMVGVSGRLESGRYQAKEGHTVYTTEVNCNNITMIEWKDNNNRNQSADHGDFSDIAGFQPTNNDEVPF